MKLLALSIRGFRGVLWADLRFGGHDVLVGPNGAGKSTVIDALSLVFGRTRLVRDLTEHDFYGSRPDATSRIRIVATLAGFDRNDPERNDTWFREGRAVPKWWNSSKGTVEPQSSVHAETLCAQVAFAARFDLEELVVESIRYFHDDDEVEDPFLDDAVLPIPIRLFDDIGYYVLPARRTWEATASFASELFRKVVSTVGGIPAQVVLQERDRLREPDAPMEATAGLSPLAERIDRQLAELLPDGRGFQLRLTATDSESLLRTLVPHYVGNDGVSLPVGRHGLGLLSLQTFILLLELGRERVRMGKSFLFAMEEPELHIPPGIQRRLIAQAVSIAEQTICTSHSPRVAGYYPATSVQILDREPARLATTPMLQERLDASATNAKRKLFQDDRARLVEALMHHRVLIPEGRSEYEWFRLLSDALETGDVAVEPDAGDETMGVDTPAFGTVIGVVPTHDGAVSEVFHALQPLRGGLVLLVDGDDAGAGKIDETRRSELVAKVILRWRDGWTMEDAIGWILEGDEGALTELQDRIDHEFDSIAGLVLLFKTKAGPGRLKTDYLAYEEVSSVIGNLPRCRRRAADLLEAVTLGALGRWQCCSAIRKDDSHSTVESVVLRLEP
ncbi:MAG: AAA family ATPase [Gammaproteobacteria bacterium]|nr:AAA family ATPase [Gammaproteobacteria bacterium]